MFRLDNLAGDRVDVILVFIPVCHEFQLKNRGSVIVIEFLIVKYRVRCIDIRLGKRNFLCFFQCDVGGRLAVFGIGGIIVIVVNGHDAGGKLQSLDRFLRAGAHISQKIVAGKYRTGFQLQDDVLFVAVNVIHKVTCLIDLNNQIPQDGLAVFSDIIRIGLHNALAIIVPAGQGGDLAVPVVFDLDFRIDAQSKGAGFLQRCSLLRRRSASGQKDCSRYSQGRDRCKKFSSQFHMTCSFRFPFVAFVLPYTYRLREQVLKTGVNWKIFLKNSVVIVRIVVIV